MTDDDRRPTFEEVASSGGHKDATMHVGGHGEPWPDVKVLTITSAGQTYVCVRRDGSEMVTPVSSVRAGLETFASELQTAIRAVADAEDRNRE
ncbi:MAG: hypothetical protein M3Q39_07635 [Actinomycetota bacterium]|nr:hypothetical protein [Actinomycetota bacterium]